MESLIYIENPPPFRRVPTGDSLRPVPIEDGVQIAREYLKAGVPLNGFHHSDLDPYEAKRRGDSSDRDMTRYDTFKYAAHVHAELDALALITAPHRIVVYHTPAEQEASFRALAAAGIRNVVLVGKPYSKHPDGIEYRASVEAVLAHLSRLRPELDFNLGVIGIHTRAGEAGRIADKFEAAGGRLRVMGQFVDDVETMASLLERIAREFDARGLNLERLEWNVGLAMIALKNRKFYAQLLRKDQLACEHRFAKLRSMQQRLAASTEMNVEFAERIGARAGKLGIGLGFSIQPIIERYRNGRIHPSVHGAVRLAKRISALAGARPAKRGKRSKPANLGARP